MSDDNGTIVSIQLFKNVRMSYNELHYYLALMNCYSCLSQDERMLLVERVVVALRASFDLVWRHDFYMPVWLKCVMLAKGEGPHKLNT